MAASFLNFWYVLVLSLTVLSLFVLPGLRVPYQLLFLASHTGSFLLVISLTDFVLQRHVRETDHSTG